jgi:hypothetical protein
MERRKDVRIETRERVVMTFVLSPCVPHLEQHTLHCTMHDTSFGGASVHTYTHVPVGTTVNLSVRTEDTGAFVKRTGVVVWEKDIREDIVLAHRLGIRLAPPSAHVLHQWRRMVEGLQVLRSAV